MLQLQALLYGVLPVAAALILIATGDLYRTGKRMAAILAFIVGIAVTAAALTDWQAAAVMLAAGLARWRFRASPAMLLLAGAVYGGLSMMWAD